MKHVSIEVLTRLLREKRKDAFSAAHIDGHYALVVTWDDIEQAIVEAQSPKHDPYYIAAEKELSDFLEPIPAEQKETDNNG